MADAPWVKFYTEDFLQGVRLANMTAEESGVYVVILMLMAARSGPIEHDSKWINSYAGCPSVRKCTAVIERLITLGKLERRDGMIGNARMLQTIEERNERSDKARRAAMERWREDDQQELDLHDGTELAPVRARTEENLSGDYRPIYRPDKVEDKSEISKPIKSKKRQKSASSPHAPAYATRAGDSELRDSESSQPNPSLLDSRSEIENPSGRDGPGEKKSRLDNPDLKDLYDAVSDVSGFSPASPGPIDLAYRTIEDWRREGIDFDDVVIPTIRSIVASSREPTRTLGRFSAAVRHEHARRKALGHDRKSYAPPPSPIMEPHGEHEALRPLRVALLKRMGAPTYCSFLNAVTLEAVDDDRAPLRVKGPPHAVSTLCDSLSSGPLLKILKSHGFKEIWNG